jgi:hypothetical protein
MGIDTSDKKGASDKKGTLKTSSNRRKKPAKTPLVAAILKNDEDEQQ